MPVTDPQLLAGIQAALANAIQPAWATQQHSNDLYEAYIFALVVESARSEGATVQYRDVTGAQTNALLLRTSPGGIYIQNPPYCYAHLTFPLRPELEVHLGVYASGSSGAKHECDIMVLDSLEAQNCRQSHQHIHPRHSKLFLHIECKFYPNADLQMQHGRGFVGLVSDLQSNGFFVSDADATGIRYYLIGRGKNWVLQLDPTQNREVQRFRALVGTEFRNYRSRRV
jgi:hypothetical protein